MDLYELNKLIQSLDKNKDRELIEFYNYKKVGLIDKIKYDLNKYHPNIISWYKEVNPSLGDLMYELDYNNIDLSVDDFTDIIKL